MTYHGYLALFAAGKDGDQRIDELTRELEIEVGNRGERTVRAFMRQVPKWKCIVVGCSSIEFEV